MKRVDVLMVLTMLSGPPVVLTQPAAPAQLDTHAIEQAIGRAGQMLGDVYKISLPRSDLSVSVGSLKLQSGLALGSWLAFRRAGSEAVAHGDLVLTDVEVNAVISALQADGLGITALHNHLLGESPRVMYLHFWGRGPEARLAAALKTALGQTKTPITPDAPTASQADVPGADVIQETLGHKGTIRGGVLAISVPRPERITMMGVELPPSMGMGTALNFQAAGQGRLATTGDFVLTADEVNRVAKALRDHGITITALHSHIMHGSPELHFMHFWAVDAPAKLAAGLKAGLDAIRMR